MKQALVRVAARAGVSPAVGIYRALHKRLRQTPMGRRDALDMRNMLLLMRSCLGPSSNCIDVGANVGTVLRHILEICPAGEHIAFEPLSYHADGLRVQFPTVDVRQIALSDQAGPAQFTEVYSAGDSPYSGFRPQWYPHRMNLRTITVESGRLDALLPAGYRPDFIKVDVEGAERDVIAGALDTLRQYQPIVIFEHFAGGAAAGYGYGPNEMYDLLVHKAGMQIFDIDGAGPYSMTRMQDVFDSRRLWTWVARPKSRAS